MTPLGWTALYLLIAALVFGATVSRLEKKEKGRVKQPGVVYGIGVFSVLWPLSVSATIAFYLTEELLDE